MLKAILFTILSAGLFTASIDTYLSKRQGDLSNHWTSKIDGRSKASKPK